jgi:PPOX class probable F420-dependent enzyme
MDERVRTFLEEHHSAAMVTLRADGTPHVTRVGVGLVDGRLWSSGTQGRVRTRHLRRDPRSTLFVFDDRDRARWLGLESAVRVLDGPEVPELSLRFFRTLQGRPVGGSEPSTLAWFGREVGEREFLDAMAAEGRILYEFEVKRAYGMY